MTQHPQASEYEVLNDLPEDRRRELLGHAEACANCRQVLTRCDPAAIFSLLSLEPIPEFSLARLSREVEAAVAKIGPVDEPVHRVRVGWSGVAALAASLLLAVLFGYQGNQGLQNASGERDTSVHIAETLQSDEVKKMIALPIDPLLPYDRTPERGLELISSPGEAEVVGFALGDTQVMMIFDKALDI